METLPLIWCLALAGAVAPLLPTGQEGCQAILRTQLQGEMLTVRGECLNPTAATLHLRYELRTDKQGASGTSRNTQSGAFTVNPQQTLALSQITIRVVPADTYRILLRVLDARGNLVAQDSVRHSANQRP